MGNPPECEHRPPCPGCPHFGHPGLSLETERELRAWCQALGVSPLIRAGAPFGYRVRSRLSVRPGPRGPEVGIFREGTHELVDIPHCGVHHPLINESAAALKRAMKKSGTAAYVEAKHRGLVRALQVVVERPTSQVQLSVTLNSTSFEPGRALASAIQEELQERLQGLYLNLQPAVTNVLLGQEFLHCSGAATTVEWLGGAQVFFPPGAFGQANLGLFEKVLEDLHAQIPNGAKVVEFHAGTGGIGLGLISRAQSYGFNEVGEHSLAGLDLGIRQLDEVLQAKVSVARGRAATHAELSLHADVVIVDPPRKGLEVELVEALSSEAGPAQLFYLSCDFASLVRDCARLTSTYRVRGVWAYSLVPFTNHVETLVHFERRRV